MKPKRLVGFVIFSLSFLLALLGPGANAAPTFPTSGQFDQVTTIVAPRLKLSFVQSISFKGNDIRVDKTDLSQLIPLTQIETADTMYFYSSAAGSGEKTPITTKLPPLLDRMDSDTKAKLKGAVKSGSESFEGYSCDIYKTSDQSGTEDIQFWVSTDPNFPFTLKTVATDKALEKVTTVNLQNINLNVKIGDSVFEVPANIKIVAAKTADQNPTAAEGQTVTPSATGTGPKP